MQERTQLRDRLGITSPADLGRLLQLLPHELIDVLRVTAVVRGIAATLGGTIHDRLRINATYALQVMPSDIHDVRAQPCAAVILGRYTLQCL